MLKKKKDKKIIKKKLKRNNTLQLKQNITGYKIIKHNKLTKFPRQNPFEYTKNQRKKFIHRNSLFNDVKALFWSFAMGKN